MYYSPGNIEPYAPIWFWGEREHRSYCHLANVTEVSFSKLTDGVLSYQTALQVTPCTSAAALGTQTDDEAVVARMRPFRGRVFCGALPWVVAALTVDVWRKQGMRYHGVLLWNVHTGEAVAELPYLDEPPEQRHLLMETFRQSLLELLPGAQLAGVSAVRPQHASSQAVLQQLPGVALAGGIVSATGKTGIRVSTILGDHRMLHPVSLEEEVPSKALIASAETRVLESAVHGLIRMAVLPPTYQRDVLTFNKRLATSPHRLFSWEILRVLQSLQTIRLWYERWPAVAALAPAEVEADLIKDRLFSSSYLCIDEFTKCFKPVRHLWRTDVDTTWHGQPGLANLETRLLDRL